jgi:Flp pilus assembly protein TadB
MTENAETVALEAPDQGTVPPVGEEVHMPGSSIIPLLNAAALACTIVSVTLSPVLVIAFGIAFIWTTAIWIRDTRRDIAELPLDHSHH